MSIAHFSISWEIWVCLLLNYIFEKFGKEFRLFMRLGENWIVIGACERGRVGIAVVQHT